MDDGEFGMWVSVGNRRGDFIDQNGMTMNVYV